ncbi:glycosyltransferase family 39 protein [bacterium]|nr:glycosyltransferase family 39 protein [bacterium]
MKKLFKIFKDRWHSPPVWVWGLTALALIYRIFLMRYRFAAAFDEVNYLKLAASMVEHGPAAAFHAFWTPFLPWMTAIFSSVIGNIELAGRWVSMLSGILLIPVIYQYALPGYGRTASIWAIILLAFAPGLAYLQTGVLTEGLYTFLTTLGIIKGWKALKDEDWKKTACIGVIFGMAYLTRPEGIGLIMVYAGLIALLLFARWLKEHSFDRTLAISGVSAVVAFLVIAAPYLIFLKVHSGHWTISGKTANLQGEVYAMTHKADDVDIYRLLSQDNTSQPIDQLYHEGRQISLGGDDDAPVVAISIPILIRKYLININKVLKEGIPFALSTVIMILMALGLFARHWKSGSHWREFYLMSFVAFFWFIVIPFFHISERYFIPFLPICFMWAGKGAVILSDWVLNSFGKLRPRLAVLLPGIIILFAYILPGFGKIIVKKPFSDHYWDIPVEQKVAGQWLKTHLQPGEGIMSRFHTCDIYAGNVNLSQSVDIPLNDIVRIHKYARYKQLRYLMLNERYRFDNPNLDSLWNHEPPSFMTKIYDETPAPGLRTLIFRFEDIQ